MRVALVNPRRDFARSVSFGRRAPLLLPDRRGARTLREAARHLPQRILEQAYRPLC